MPPAPPTYLTIGQITSPWGLKGEVKAEVLTDFPDRFSLLHEVYLGPDHRRAKLQHARRHKNGILLKFDGYDSPEKAEELRGLLIDIPIAEAMPLGPDQYYEHQILGLEVWTMDGEYLGKVDEILYPGSNDVYVVKGNGREVLIPVIGSVVREINLETGRILIQPMEGLL